MNIVKYDFYQDYVKKDKNFEVIMERRVKYIQEKYLPYLTKVSGENPLRYPRDELIKEYFVEIFSWTVLPYQLLQYIYNIIKQDCTRVLDPCCGNSFHTYLFENFTPLDCLSYDIQDEENSWTKITEQDGLLALKEIKDHKNICLILSWIDYEKLSLELLHNFNGNIIINIGNYVQHGRSPIYLKTLYNEFNLIQRIVLEMPWNLTENLEILRRKHNHF